MHSAATYSVSRTFLEISSTDLEHNLRAVRQFISPAKLISLIKAYGVGVENLLSILLKVGINELG